MKKQFITLLAILTFVWTANSQSKGVRIGYIDMEYILQNVPDYIESKNQLEQKAQGWKSELETKRNDIDKLIATLKSEKVLLTKELIEEREEDIKFQENELQEIQQKRFGSNGDLIVQKTLLVQPIQDQVFTAIQDMADAKKYDFIFDKSSDLTILFAAKKYDVSDQVLKIITRSSKRSQLSKKQLKIEDEKEKKLEEQEANPGLTERQKILDEKRAAREKLLADKKTANELRRQEIETNRLKLLAEREAKKNGTVSGNNVTTPTIGNITTPTTSTITTKPVVETADTSAKDEARRLALERQEAKKAEFEARKKALEEKRLKTLADREAAKKAREEANKKP